MVARSPKGRFMHTSENRGPAETIIQALLAQEDHMVHNRPGIVVPDNRSVIGVSWTAATCRVETEGRVVYRLDRNPRRLTRMGTIREDNKVYDDRRVPVGVYDDRHVRVGVYRPAGLFPEVVAWMYQQVANVWSLDNELAARWASYAFTQTRRDSKVILAAFLLVQSRKGEPIFDEAGKMVFEDDDYRNVGEAMLLLRQKGNDFDPKLLLRVSAVLRLPEVAQINRDLGFGHSTKNPFLGRWPKTVERWLRYREENPRILEGLQKAGFRKTVIALAQRIGYRPTTERFCELLRWKQKQASDGRRSVAIGKVMESAESWHSLDETAICERIIQTRPGWKRIGGLLPGSIGLTPAIAVAAIEAGSLSDKDLIILTPTLEELGVLDIPAIRERHACALARANDMRAAHIARNVRSATLKAKLETAADKAVQQVVAEVTRGLRFKFLVDVSGSMEGALQAAMPLVAKFLQSFPTTQVHVAIFNTYGRELVIKDASTAGVEAAFRGISPGGGTDYGAGVRALAMYQPSADEDVVYIFVGDEDAKPFDQHVIASGSAPLAFGLLRTVSSGASAERSETDHVAVRETARRLGIPCFRIHARTFEDPYAIGRTIRDLLAATPVDHLAQGRGYTRVSLVDEIRKTELLEKPDWA